jgi:anti-sigma factor RsiW
MHDIVMSELEKHFTGDASRAFYDHLEVCDRCREEVAEMDRISLVFEGFRPEPGVAPEPQLGFYNRVAGTIVDRQRKEAWGLFSPGAEFFRRIAFAALLLLASLGSFLVTRENVDSGADAAAIMAAHDIAPDHAPGADRDQILVTLASYNRE